jgi:hypothetical protein
VVLPPDINGGSKCERQSQSDRLFFWIIFIAIFILTIVLSIYIIFNDSFFVGFLMLLVSIFGICSIYNQFVKYRSYKHKELKQIMKANPSISIFTRKIRNKKDMGKYISSKFMYNSQYFFECKLLKF